MTESIEKILFDELNKSSKTQLKQIIETFVDADNNPDIFALQLVGKLERFKTERRKKTFIYKMKQKFFDWLQRKIYECEDCNLVAIDVSDKSLSQNELDKIFDTAEQQIY